MNNNQFEQLIRQIQDRVKGGPANEETFDFASIKTNSARRDRRTCIGKMLNALFLPFSLLVFALSALAESGESRHDDAVVSSAGEGVSDRPVELVRPDGSVELFTSRDEAVDAANAAVTHEPWYTPVESGDTVRIVLNAQATPVIGKVDFGEADASTVSVWPDNVKPNLLYGLGRSETPNGPFVVEDGAWVRADANGVLHEALSAPKIGPQGFYRVIVR